ncbi:MAG: peptidoglycan synthetase, partial [Bacteroidetes bacterium]
MKGKIHFIAIGGSAMHNLAIALNRNGYKVTGSDDEIFEPSRSRLEREGILPVEIGWYPEKITEDLEAVILGMHARADNPELAKAKQLGIRIFSYPEYLYEQSKNKQRVVIGGSHGKTTITSMLLHGMKELNVEVDYMVGAQLDGYDCMVQITDSAPFMILEGDEYLSSPIDRRPKFHLYKPNIALISGIAWDHINVFPTFENYVEQFRVFADLIEDSGSLIYNEEDPNVKEIGEHLKSTVQGIPYGILDYSITDNGTVIHYDGTDFPLKIFGGHNLQNLMGAMYVASKMGVEPKIFLEAMKNFTGAGKRLQSVLQSDELLVYKDFAHSPSKLKATTKAVKEQYANKRLIACMELHTFSSLQKDFLPQYSGAMDTADMAMV